MRQTTTRVSAVCLAWNKETGITSQRADVHNSLFLRRFPRERLHLVLLIRLSVARCRCPQVRRVWWQGVQGFLGLC